MIEALGLCKGGEEGRDYIVCCPAYTTTVASAAWGIGIIGIGASIVCIWYKIFGFMYIQCCYLGIGTVVLGIILG